MFSEYQLSTVKTPFLRFKQEWRSLQFQLLLQLLWVFSYVHVQLTDDSLHLFTEWPKSRIQTISCTGIMLILQMPSCVKQPIDKDALCSALHSAKLEPLLLLNTSSLKLVLLMKVCFLLTESANAVTVGNLIWEQLDILCKKLYSPQVAETFSITDAAAVPPLSFSLKTYKRVWWMPCSPPHHSCPGRVYRTVTLLSISMWFAPSEVTFQMSIRELQFAGKSLTTTATWLKSPVDR